MGRDNEIIHGGDIYRNRPIYDFSANINPLGVNNYILKAATSSLKNMANYPDVDCSELRSAVASYYRIDPDYLYFGNGAADVLFSLVRAVNPRRALLFVPTFAEYEQALQSIGCQIEYYYLLEENNFVLQEDFLDRIREEVDMVILCNPNNPTGNIIDMEMLDKIRKRCLTNSCRLVIDECFQDFIEKPRQMSLMTMIVQEANLVILRAFTKMYAMAGLRLGFMVTSDRELMKKMYKVSQPWPVSIPAQAAGIEAIKQESYVLKTREYVKEQRKYLVDHLVNMNIKVYEPMANYIFFYDKRDWYKELLKHQLLIRDCSNYRGLKKGFYRIAVRSEKENKYLIRCMEEILHTDGGKQ